MDCFFCSAGNPRLGDRQNGAPEGRPNNSRGCNLRKVMTKPAVRTVEGHMSLRAKRSNLYSRTWWEDTRDCFVVSLLAMTGWGLSLRACHKRPVIASGAEVPSGLSKDFFCFRHRSVNRPGCYRVSPRLQLRRSDTGGYFCWANALILKEKVHFLGISASAIKIFSPLPISVLS